MAFEAGRIMLHRINELLHQNENFAFETTLAAKSYKNKVIAAKDKNYNTTLLFFWLRNSELAKERVKIRVQEGGHNIPEDVIERSYIKGIKNLFEIYIPIIDQVLLFDNSEDIHQLIAEKSSSNELIILDKKKFNELKHYL